MKRDNNLWKSLNNGKTGLGWNASAQKLDCADEWWKMKIKEDPNFKKLQKKQSSLELQYAWGQLFGDVVAGGEDCISSVMNTKAFQEVHNENVEDEDVESDDDLDDTQEGESGVNVREVNVVDFVNYFIYFEVIELSDSSDALSGGGIEKGIEGSSKASIPPFGSAKRPRPEVCARVAEMLRTRLDH
ncbi:hypothetical protein Tco_1206790 [Tanacetum coccineum]